jgi:GTP-binding protein EngB required for normal cell division
MPVQQSVDQLIQLFQEQSSLPKELAEEAAALRDRLSTVQLHLAVLGQFKRGKSTLINALLGAEILPSGVLPVTLVPVFLRFGTQPDLEIHYSGDHRFQHFPLDQLGDFVSEANNPKNSKNVGAVNLRYPARLLQDGVVLIDTPGVGSTLQHNTDTTLDFLPQCDAGIVVLSADPPITAAEVTFLQLVKPHVAQFFFVLNKIDYLDADGIGEARRFLSETLQASLGIEAPQIFAVSARQGLQARLRNDESAWRRSGMFALEQALLSFATNGKQVALAESVHRKMINLALHADQLLALEQRAMQLPLEELESKIATFKRYTDEARQQRQEILDRLLGDETRLAQELEDAAAILREKARAALIQEAEALNLPTADRSAIARFHEKVRAFFDRERTALGAQFRNALIRTLTERARRATEVRENLRQDAANLLDVPHFPLLTEEVVVELTEPAWTIEYLLIDATPKFGDKWWPESIQQKRHAQQRETLVDELTVRNAEKVRWWILRTIQESMRNFRQKIMVEHGETIQQIERALQAGYQQQQSQSAGRRQALEALTASRERLRQMRSDIGEVAAGTGQQISM